MYPIARFSDTRYRVKYQGIRDYGLGLFVDIYPLDGCGDTEGGGQGLVQQPMRDVRFINCCAADRFTPSRRGWLHTPAKLAGFLGPAPRKRPLHPPHRGLGPAEGL